jgi:predicted hydrocarbon binding protein
MKKFNFKWSDLGDLEEGRPNLGRDTRVETYRLMQYTMRAVLESEFGDLKSRDILVKAGRLAGVEFCTNVLDRSLDVNKFIAQLHDKLLDYKIGILRVEKMEPNFIMLVITVSEDLDCSGLPVSGNTVCDYDEGFFQGIFETYTSQNFVVKEIDCWSTGERTCRFTINKNLIEG